MLSYGRLCSKYSYLAWYRCQNLFLATTWFALGYCEEEAFRARFRGLPWLYKSLRFDKEVYLFAQASRLKMKVAEDLSDASAQGRELYSQLCTEIVDLCECGGLNDASLHDVHTAKEAFYLLGSLQRKTYFYVEAKFPPFMYDNQELFKLLVNPTLGRNCTEYACDLLYAREVLGTVSASPKFFDVLRKKKDREFFKYFGFENYRYRLIAKGDTAIVVDGENTTPAEFKTFWDTNFDNPDKWSVEVTVVCPSSLKLVWEYTLNNSSCIYHIVVRDPVTAGKSLVDMQLLCEVMRAYFVNHIKEIWVMSSDSDFYTIPNNMPEASVTFIAVRHKTGKDWRKATMNNSYAVLYIDESCTKWNQSILIWNYIADKYFREEQPDIEDDSIWMDFLKKIDLPEVPYSGKRFRQMVISAMNQDTASV